MCCLKSKEIKRLEERIVRIKKDIGAVKELLENFKLPRIKRSTFDSNYYQLPYIQVADEMIRCYDILRFKKPTKNARPFKTSSESGYFVKRKKEEVVKELRKVYSNLLYDLECCNFLIKREKQQ